MKLQFTLITSVIVPLDDWLRITPRGRKCWNITLLDDEKSELQDGSIYKSLHFYVTLYTSKSIQSHYSQVFIADDENGKISN